MSRRLFFFQIHKVYKVENNLSVHFHQLWSHHAHFTPSLSLLYLTQADLQVSDKYYVHLMLSHHLPPPTHFCPLPFSSLLQLHLLLSTSLPHSAFPLRLLVWVWGLERGQETTAGFRQTKLVEEGNRARTRKREMAHITTHWPTYTSTQLIESYAEVCSQSQVGVECSSANGVVHPLLSSFTVSIQFLLIVQEQREWTRNIEKGVTDEGLKNKRRQKGKGKIDGEQLRQAEIWVLILSCTG